jgi:hypothetical protein
MLVIVVGTLGVVAIALVSATVFWWKRSQRTTVITMVQQESSMQQCFCNGPLYRIVPLVACVAALLLLFMEALDDEVLQLALCAFFTVDFVIQCVVLRGSQLDCCGDCGCGCGCTLLIKLVLDGIYLLLAWLGLSMSLVTDALESLAIFRVLRLLILAKLGMEIAALSILCMQSQGQLKPQITGQSVGVDVPVGRDHAVIGLPVTVEAKTLG